MTHVLSSFILTAIGPPNIMDDYHKRPSHHGLSELLGDKMEKEKKCKTCKKGSR